MDYAGFLTAIVAETNITITGANAQAGFIAILPTIIDQAEGRIYREPGLEFLSSVVTDTSGSTAANTRQFTLPQHFTVLQSVNIIQNDERTPLSKYSREALDFLWPSNNPPGPASVPLAWAPLTDQVIVWGPCPAVVAQVECIGNVRPANLSASNTDPWLWAYLGDLAFAAAMVFASAYMRNFGAQSDDPKMAQSWEAVYQSLLPGAKSEEMRRKFQATGGA